RQQRRRSDVGAEEEPRGRRQGQETGREETRGEIRQGRRQVHRQAHLAQEGGMTMCRDTPSPALPTRGRLWHRVYGTISHRPPAGTSPIVGEAGRGDGRWL